VNTNPERGTWNQERLLLSLLACTVVLAACSSAPRGESTSIRKPDCTEPPAEIATRFAAAGVGGQQCPGIQGWQVFVVSSDGSSWLELHAAGRNWSFEEPIVHEQPIGRFPAMDDGAGLEWRIDARRGPTAVIATVAAQSTGDAESRLTRYFVIRLDGTRNACVIARAETMAAARSTADGGRQCG
jgi:hypothetical protein